MPEAAVQRSASLMGSLNPARTAPFPLTALPKELDASPSPPPSIGRPRSTIPPALVQRKAWLPLEPTTTEPSSLTSAPDDVVPPGTVPRLTIPPALVQRKAWLPLEPTTTVPSRLTSMAQDCVSPGRNPSPKKVWGCAARAARPGSRRNRMKTATRLAAFVRMPGLMAAPPAICPGCCGKDVPQERPIARDFQTPSAFRDILCDHAPGTSHPNWSLRRRRPDRRRRHGGGLSG